MSRTPPIVSVLPTRGLVDEKFKVLVENLPPGRPVTVRSLHRSEDDHYWEAFGFYTSDHRGTVNVSKDPSVGGTYTGKEPMGLLWSMCPVPGSRKGLRLRKLNVCSPMLVNISVHSGHEGFRDQTPLASVLIERWYMAPGVKRIDVRERGLKGTLFLPPGPGPFPGILDLWGGGGGLVEYRSALLASHGFATMSLDYLSCSQSVFTYGETAFNFIKDHPQVVADRIGVVGLCIGSLLALYLAADSTVVKPRCTVCISTYTIYPTDRVLSGSFEELTILSDKISVDKNNNEMWRDVGLEIMSDSRKVNTGKLTTPLLLVSGCDDQNWPSFETAEDITQTMRAAGNDHLLSRLDYSDTGHLIEPPFSPHFRSTKFVTIDKRKVMILWGGLTKPHSDAQEDSWKKILSFLQQHLCSSLNAKL
ncbi:acyl-coenzyme A thioesterase 1-like [Acanthochromis polyacanthus]|uniref:acyl-coenzyme A thioesterase 1-like n=1 Tax=Acanthochromis polyacanthus TaxID=80966 RepID=UPI002233F143|nr:acyl-coenzyme A thioesterase 1-like [Acanthochromis polyacanthus]XP_051805786.1 acyl-coenzyme A thioesterase 1-like [Acanthochromis polyacanthus]